MYKRFLVNFTLFSAITLAVLYILNYIVDTGVKKEQISEFPTWTAIYDGKINADLLIVGNSRAKAQISPVILDSVLGTDSYNLGMEGWNFSMNYARFRIYTAHNKLPKYIVMSLSYGILSRNIELYDYGQFLPYLHDTILQNATKGYVGSFPTIDFYIPFIKYRSQYSLVKRGITNFIKSPPAKPDVNKGFYGRLEPWDGAFEKFAADHKDTLEPIKIDSSTYHLFIEFLDFCTQHNIKVILVNTPEYAPAQKYFAKRAEEMDMYNRIAGHYQIPFLDYSNDTLCNSTKYFNNSQHFNKTGAELFSRELAHDLKKYIH